jgi:hypothetical protein
MGLAIEDDTTLDVLAMLNKRFGPSVIKDMIALQKEFGIFNTDHPLQDSFRLLGIEPCDRVERERWYHFLNKLKKYPSDVPELNGYQRVIVAFEQALLPPPPFPPRSPLPVFVTVHKMSDDPRVTFDFKGGRPLIFSVQTYRILSIPTKPGRIARQEAAAAAKARRAKADKK